ncbi:uncharacterized protein YJR142W [Caerostris extrusa]|uniref:Uncharacterized protein YJR142W n=1 Tax=Caerostris extrusa TaxID=172846 RepID=A0AAV4SKU9_CAEEX|nr:uncharacterized protein YJR142W [Caerostris extrusa]
MHYESTVSVKTDSDKMTRNFTSNFNLKSKIGPHEGDCREFYVGAEKVGIIRPDIWRELLHYSTVFHTLSGWRNECYDVSSKFGDVPVMKMERSATCLFGIKRCGVHVNGYVKNADGSKSVWIQKRSFTKPTWPGKLDNMVSGGFSVGMTVVECVHKEAQEEASLTSSLLNSMIPAGIVSFVFEDERGIFPETLFVFDVEIPSDFIPTNSDNEVESFHLLSIDELKRVIVTDDFKLTSSVVTLDFLVRHGYLNCDDEPNYIKLLETLHTPLHYH